MPETFPGRGHKSFCWEEKPRVPGAFPWPMVGSCSLGRFQGCCALPGGHQSSPMHGSRLHRHRRRYAPFTDGARWGGVTQREDLGCLLGSLSGKPDASTLSLLVPCVFSRSVVSDSLQPHRLQPARLLCPWDSPGKHTGVGCHSLLQGIFPTQGSKPGLPLCRWILYQLSHQGSPPPCPLTQMTLMLSRVQQFKWEPDLKSHGGGGRRGGGHAEVPWQRSRQKPRTETWGSSRWDTLT